MKILNLYSGIGGNRLLWGTKHEITAVENNEKVAKVYAKLFPRDKVVVEDAHTYLLKHYSYYDFIWSSPPCVTHSRLNFSLREKRYPDLTLYEEIIFLKWLVKRIPFIIENVVGYYSPLVAPSATYERHQFWSNLTLPKTIRVPKFPGIGSNLNEKEYTLQKLRNYGFGDLSLAGIKRPRQIVDNCVPPLIGKALLPNLL